MRKQKEPQGAWHRTIATPGEGHHLFTLHEFAPVQEAVTVTLWGVVVMNSNDVCFCFKGARIGIPQLLHVEIQAKMR